MVGKVTYFTLVWKRLKNGNIQVAVNTVPPKLLVLPIELYLKKLKDISLLPLKHYLLVLQTCYRKSTEPSVPCPQPPVLSPHISDLGYLPKHIH